ncbi:MAG TPA: Rne/Rng family ribonuclease [Acidobacteriaceae bacterium]|jgi:ribonuclease G|nr:Rne/Rng family ribonuclease [Acidobacteriaceae bacterium]
MAKEICISSTPHETRLAILEDDQLAEIYYERENEYTLAGSIYKGRVTRVLPGMQSAFVDLGLERDAFLYVTDFLEEQEDSEEFDTGNDGGNGRRREPREGRESAPRGDQRESRPRSPERTQEGEVDLSASESPRRSDSDRNQDRGPREGDRGRDQEQGGTRRWHGRRGRRFRGRPDESTEPRSESRSGGRSESRPESRRDQSSLESPEIVEEAISAEPIARPERGAPGGVPAQNLPIVLPGESLSKYGGGGRAESRQRSGAPSSSAPASRGASKPSTMVEVTGGWDGGNVLPGESLSRHRGRRSESTGGEQAAAPVEQQPERAVAEASVETAIAPVDVPESSHYAAEAQESAVAPAPAAPENLEASVAPIAAIPQHHEETVEETHEYEPEEASASHRVDVPRSEFRFSPPEAPAELAPEFEEQTDEEIVEEEDEPASFNGHEPEATVETPHEHESHQHEFSTTPASEPTPEAEVMRQLFGYAPGMGVLEEETIDEDEYDFEPIPGQPDEHITDEMEEQTLDNGSTVEDAVRDVHIEKRLGYDTPAEAAEGEETEDLERGFVEIEESDFEESEGSEEDEEGSEESPEHSGEERAASPGQPARREGGRRFDRRGGRGRQQGGGGRRHGRRPNMQTSDLPIISELLKQGQEILVQIAKEPIARKGARITSHIALPGRFLVFMPTVNHVGVSRKIDSDEERQRLKRILISEKGTASGGFIVRTAAENAGEDDLRADIRFLINLWAEIKQRSDSAKPPALLYHDLNLIERILRDQVSDNFSTIWVDSESEYERIVRFLNRFQPSLVRRVKLYTKETPLFEQFGIQEEISKALKSKVWLKSGGSIVINQTEALVAIDINTGKYVGKTARLEDTILKTNLDAIPEIVRQIRLRDLGGIIVIDFIDMDERRNRQKVTQALEDALQADRAPSKVLQFNDFGLVAITRKRVKQSLERTLSVPCPVCTGTGMVKSPTTVANEIWIEMRKMLRHLDRGDVLLRVHPDVVKVLKTNNGKWLNELEEMTGKTIIVKSDPALPPEQFDIQG